MEDSGEKSSGDSVLELIFCWQSVKVVLKTKYSAIWGPRSKRWQRSTLNLFLYSLDTGQGCHKKRSQSQVTNANTVQQVQVTTFMLVVEPCITATLGTTIPEDHSFKFTVRPKNDFHPSALRRYYLG